MKPDPYKRRQSRRYQAKHGDAAAGKEKKAGPGVKPQGEAKVVPVVVVAEKEGEGGDEDGEEDGEDEEKDQGGSRFSRRKVTSNWDRFEEEEEIPKDMEERKEEAEYEAWMNSLQRREDELSLFPEGAEGEAERTAHARRAKNKSKRPVIGVEWKPQDQNSRLYGDMAVEDLLRGRSTPSSGGDSIASMGIPSQVAKSPATASKNEEKIEELEGWLDDLLG